MIGVDFRENKSRGIGQRAETAFLKDFATRVLGKWSRSQKGRLGQEILVMWVIQHMVKAEANDTIERERE